MVSKTKDQNHDCKFRFVYTGYGMLHSYIYGYV